MELIPWTTSLCVEDGDDGLYVFGVKNEDNDNDKQQSHHLIKVTHPKGKPTKKALVVAGCCQAFP